jgi:hypothetical protein
MADQEEQQQLGEKCSRPLESGSWGWQRPEQKKQNTAGPNSDDDGDESAYSQ